MDSTARLSVLCSAGIFFTTIQSQDFKDVEGDTLIGRQTIPIVHPTLAAPTLALSLQAWSLGLAILWHANLMTAVAINALSLAVGICYIISTSCKAYQRSFYLYNVSPKIKRASCLYYPVSHCGVSGLAIICTRNAALLAFIYRFSGY